MKHYLPRFSRLQIFCIAILACMLAPVAVAASVTTAAPVAPGGGTLLALAGLGLGGMMLRAPADDPAAGGGGEGGGGSASDPEDAKLSIGQRLQAALSSKSSLVAKNTALEGQVKDLAGQIEAKDSELKDLRAKVTALEADAKQVADALAASEKEVKELAAKEKEVGKRADRLAKEKLGALGFPSAELPKATEQGAADTDLPSSREELETALSKMTDGTKQRELLNRWKAAQAA